MKEERANLGSMVAESAEALKRLAKDVNELKRLVEIQALRENSRSIFIEPQDMDEVCEN